MTLVWGKSPIGNQLKMTTEIRNGDDTLPEVAKVPPQETGVVRLLPAPAQRALREAAARRRETEVMTGREEIGGRGGLDPVRFGDWEVKGLTSDF